MNTERDDLAKTLGEIARGSRRSKIVRLREIFDDVEGAKANGASNKEIVAGLAEHGLIFDVNNFKNARSRILKERAMEALSMSASAGTVAVVRRIKPEKSVVEKKTPIKSKPVASGNKVVPEVKKAGETKTGGGGLLSDLATPVDKTNIPDSEL